MRRAEIERHAGEALARPEDAWLVWGDDLDRFLDDDGRVDAEAVRTAAGTLARERPTWRKGGPVRRDPDQGRGSWSEGSSGGWEALIEGARE
jgi:hypothetical protein